MTMALTRQRTAPPAARQALQAAGLHPLLARLFAARGIQTPHEISDRLSDLHPPSLMANIDLAAARLAQAIEHQESMLVVADFDADGATACAVALRGLRRLGGQVDFLVPDRFRFGYGLTTTLIEQAILSRPKENWPKLIITVDNGISSVDGVALAQSAGLDVLVTDHHLPGKRLPDTLIVNPNLSSCGFPSKNLAGVGVMFYVLMALRAHLKERLGWAADDTPRLDDLLPIVALGTVADVVKLDANNRRLVAQGLARLRKGGSFAGLNALFSVAGIDVRQANATHFGFAIGPRLNSAGRLSDMSIGIRCLIEDDPQEAHRLASELDRLNLERREIESTARDEALTQAQALAGDPRLAESARFSIVLHDAGWHQGVIGLIAGRLKDHFHRPVIVFADDTAVPGRLKGSGRSITGVHLRDVLERIDTQNPGLLHAFGGHAMAAGLSIDANALPQFATLFEQTICEFAEPADLSRLLETDGSLEPEHLRLDIAEMLNQQIWGQGFPAPLFCDTFQVLSQRRLKDKHLKLTLARPHTAGAASQGPRSRLEAIWFNAPHDLGSTAMLAYRVATNTWQGLTQIQLEIVDVAEPSPDSPQAYEPAGAALG